MPIKVSPELLDQLNGCTFNPDVGCFEDDDRVNWWLEGHGRGMVLVNRAPPQGVPGVPADLAAELLSAADEKKRGGKARDVQISLRRGCPELHRKNG
jgi:hypothetical protein